METPSIRVYLLRHKPLVIQGDSPLKFERVVSQQLFVYLSDMGEDIYTRSELSRLLYEADDAAARRKFSQEALYFLPASLKDPFFDQSDVNELDFAPNNIWVDSRDFAARAGDLLRHAPLSTSDQVSEAKTILTLYQGHFLQSHSSKSPAEDDHSSFSAWRQRRQKELAALRHQLLDEIIRYSLERHLDLHEIQHFAEQWLGSLNPGTMPLQYLIWIAASQHQNEALRSYLEQLAALERNKAVVLGPSAAQWTELINSQEPVSLSLLHLRDLRRLQDIVSQDSEPLIGRDVVLEEIYNLLSANVPRTFALVGLPGAGKTQVARAAVRILREKRPTYRVLELELTPELDFELLLNYLLTQLGMQQLVNLNIAAKRQHLKQLLQAPNLYIFVDEGHTQHLKDPGMRANLLEALEGARIILIARQIESFDHYKVEIPGLTSDQTRELLCQRIPRLKQTDDALFVELTKLTSGLPLLLHIIAGFIRKERIRLTSLIQELTSLNNKAQDRNDISTVYKTILQWLWHYMHSEDQHLLCVVGLFDSIEGATLEALTAVCDSIYSPGIVLQKTKLLTEMRLLEFHQASDSAYYTLHPIIFALVREQAQQQAGRLRSMPRLEQAYIRHMLDFVSENHGQPLSLDGQKRNILRLFDLVLVAGQHEWARPQAVKALHQMSPYFEKRGLYTAASKLIERALEITGAQAADPMRVYLLHHAGQMAAKQSRYELAQDFLRKSLDAAVALNMVRDYGLLYLDLGLAQMQALDSVSAQTNFDYAEEWATTYGPQQLVYRIWVNLGVHAFRSDEFKTAYTYYKKALDGLGDDLENLAPELQDIAQFALNAIGITLTSMWKPALAQEYHQRSLVLARANNDPERLGYVYLNLGVTYFFLKKYDAARDCFIQGQHFARRTQNQELLIQITWNRGALASAEDQHDMALRLLNLALTRAEKYQLHRVRAIVLVALGKACLKQRWLPRAEQCFVEALTSQSLSNVYTARALYGLTLCAVINTSNGDDDADATYQQFQGLMKRLNFAEPFPPSVSKHELRMAQKYYQHDFGRLYRLSHYRIVEALEKWRSSTAT